MMRIWTLVTGLNGDVRLFEDEFKMIGAAVNYVNSLEGSEGQANPDNWSEILSDIVHATGKPYRCVGKEHIIGPLKIMATIKDGAISSLTTDTFYACDLQVAAISAEFDEARVDDVVAFLLPDGTSTTVGASLVPVRYDPTGIDQVYETLGAYQDERPEVRFFG